MVPESVAVPQQFQLSDLQDILGMKPIISTFPVSSLQRTPRDVEAVYLTHAKTYIQLAATEKYVDTIFKWVSGQNQGAFVGAVIGDNGQGKTSFQVHVWEQSRARSILAVPPFSWQSLDDILAGTAAWVDFCLMQSNPQLAAQAKRLFESCRGQGLREIANKVAEQSGGNADDIYAMYIRTEQAGGLVSNSLTPERYLTYCAEVTEIIQQAGFAGLLVMLDEPEVAARAIGMSQIFYIMFELADGLYRQQGNYGVFFSIPEQVYSQAQAQQQSLPARLECRQCLPRLYDLYKDEFAATLWSRYMQLFGLESQPDQIVAPAALQAIGQVTSSTRKDLGYGPRSVISAFHRIIHHYNDTHSPYQPIDFITDCLEQEILVTPDYRSKVGDILQSPEVTDATRDRFLLLSAFPNGLTFQLMDALGIKEEMLTLARNSRGVIEHRPPLYVRLIALIPGDGGVTDDDLAFYLRGIKDEYALHAGTFKESCLAFIDYVIPLLIKKRSGGQLTDFEYEGADWVALQDMGDTRVRYVRGAFQRGDYPERRYLIAVGPDTVETRQLRKCMNRRDTDAPDIIIHFALRWNVEASTDHVPFDCSAGSPSEKRPGFIRIVMNLVGDPVQHEGLESILDPSVLTPMGILFLMRKMAALQLPTAVTGQWKAIQDPLLRQIVTRFFADQTFQDKVGEALAEPIHDITAAIIGRIALFLLKKRFPEYVTLIRTPQWKQKVQDYINVLAHAEVPVVCKRGGQTWEVPGQKAASVFGISVMNLTGGGFDGYESLLIIRSMGRDKPLLIEFKLHPLEQAIRDKIQEPGDSEKITVNGKEVTWWIDVKDIMDLFLTSGYTAEELLLIFEIGKARGTFDIAKHNGSRILFCLPINPEEMRERLLERWNALKEEINTLSAFVGFEPSVKLEELLAEIRQVADENAYEALNHRISLAHAHNSDQLSSIVANYRMQLGGLSDRITRTQTALAQSGRDAVSLDRDISGQSKWCSDLNTYIVTNLRRMKTALRSTATELQGTVEAASTKLAQLPIGTQDRIAAISGVADQIKQLGASIGDLEGDSRAFDSSRKLLGNWIQLLRSSDQLSSDILKLKADPDHAAKADELYKRLIVIWGDISDHLMYQNIAGLGAYQQFKKQLDELNQEREDYWKNLHARFKEAKEAILGILRAFGIEDRLDAGFDQEDVAGSYTRLYEKGAQAVQGLLVETLRDLSKQSLELRYARDILKRVSADQADELVAGLDDIRDTLSTTLASVNSDWIIALVGSATKEADIEEFKTAVFEARRLTKETNDLIRQAVAGAGDDLGETAQTVFHQVEQTEGDLNMKQVVLALLNTRESADHVLDECLEAMAELFRSGKVDITIRKGRR